MNPLKLLKPAGKPIVLILAYAFLPACGGGGSSPAPAMPPAVDTVAPVVVFSSATLEVSSDSTGTANVSATDNVGVTSGVLTDCTNDGDFSGSTFTAPVVFVETVSVCTATAMDAQGNQGSDTLTVTITPAPQGAVVAIYDPPLQLKVGNGSTIGGSPTSQQVIAVRTDPTTDLSSIAFLGGPDFMNDFANDTSPPVVGDPFEDISFVGFGALSFNLPGIFGDEFVVLSETEDTLQWYVDERSADGLTFTFFEADSLGVENPCYVTGRRNTGQDYIWLGQRDRGMSIIRLEGVENAEGLTRGFDETVLDQLGEGRSLCYIFPTQLPENIAPQFVGGNAVSLSALITIDYNANDLVLFGDSDDNGFYEELQVIPLQTQTTSQLTIVDVISKGTPSLLPRFLAILMTDGVHDGEHRLIVISQDTDTFELTQVTYSWDEGVPVSLLQGNFGGLEVQNQFKEDLVVITSTSERSLFFDNTTDFSTGVATPPTFAQPEFFEVGTGAGSAVRIQRRPGTPLEEVLVSFPDTGELKIFAIDESLVP
ncbi:MAG: hypothetical protein AB8G18_15970 [Gammaproteobacteria bacterium]